MPVPETLTYPRSPQGFVHQCAWCRNVADAHGAFVVAASALLAEASHGVCPACKPALLRDFTIVSRAAAS